MSRLCRAGGVGQGAYKGAVLHVVGRLRLEGACTLWVGAVGPFGACCSAAVGRGCAGHASRGLADGAALSVGVWRGPGLPL